MSTLNKIIKECDIIIEVVDSRAIDFTRAKDIEKRIINKGKLLMLVSMKSDLVDEKKLTEKLKKIEFPTAFASYKKRKGVKSIKKLIKIMAHRVKKDKKVEKVKVGIIGYTNSGKSSLINLITHSQKAKTSPTPAYTKKYQWIRLSKDILLIDTAGIIHSKTNKEFFVFRGNINPDKQECISHAIQLINYAKKYDSNMEKILKIDNFKSLEAFKILENYAIKRNMMLKKGEINIEMAAKEIIRKWNKGEIKMFIE